MANVKGTLKHGLKVGDKLHKDYELRESTTQDMFDAEADAPSDRRLAFQGALLARQIVKLGDLGGPLDFSLIGKLHPEDFTDLIADAAAADAAGKNAPAS
ncbi:MAG: hypothetical protein ACRES7_00160 [Gammaproteobacteria bacterium]